MTEEQLEKLIAELQREADEFYRISERGTLEARELARGIEIAIKRIRTAMRGDTDD